MRPYATALLALWALILAPLLPVLLPTVLVSVVYVAGVIILQIVVLDAVSRAYDLGVRDGERKHRLATYAEVIRLPGRSESHRRRSAS